MRQMDNIKCPDCHIGTIVNGLCDNCNLSLEDIEAAADFTDSPDGKKKWPKGRDKIAEDIRYYNG